MKDGKSMTATRRKNVELKKFVQTLDCGATPGAVTATLSDNGTLTISGKGMMKDYGKPFWGLKRDNVINVVIKDGVTSIGNHAFFGCKNLTSITIPSGVIFIGARAFGMSGLCSIIIPNGVPFIEEFTFGGCTDLSSIDIPNSVMVIGDNAFYSCKHLTSVTIPDGVMWIGNNAFGRCTSLKSVDIPSSTVKIGASAFSDCSDLTMITILNPAPPSVYKDTFDKLSKKTCAIVVPKAAVKAYRKADGWKDFLNIQGIATPDKFDDAILAKPHKGNMAAKKVERSKK
jgi:hypothetical protein